MDVVDLPLERLIPYARNPRKNAAAVATVAASMKEFGWRQPIVVDEAMVILAGHTRLEAARQLGPRERAGARRPRPHPGAGARLPADGQPASENAEWDEALLGLELGDLQGDDFDLALTGFDDAELNRLLAGSATTTAPARARTTSRRRRPTRSAGRAISGCSGRTGCSAATPRWRPTSSACSAA